jgi:hypothetical protein
VLLALVFGFDATRNQVADWWLIAWLPGYLGGTLALTVGGFGLWWRRQGLAFPSQPGHGVLLLCAATFCIAILWSLLILILMTVAGERIDNDMPTAPAWVMQLNDWASYVYLLVSLGLCVWLAWWVGPVRRWQVFFALCALVIGDTYVGRIYRAVLFDPIHNLEWIGPMLAWAIQYVVDHVPSFVPAIALLLAIVWDHREGIRWHWSHWAGIVAWCSGFPGEIVSALVNTGWLPSPMPLD